MSVCACLFVTVCMLNDHTNAVGRKRHPLVYAAEVDPELSVSSALQSKGEERQGGR